MLLRRAFTLIELLVAIAVIAVLTAVLFPVFARARESARRTQCLSNLKQISTAVGVYRVDYDGFPYANRLCVPQSRPSLPEVLEPYVREDHIWRCPSDYGETFIQDPTTWAKRTPPMWKWSQTSYDYFGLQMPSTWCAPDRRSGAYRFPAVAPLVAEIRPWHDHPRADELFTESSGRYVIAFADGHVARRTWAQYYEEFRAAAARR